MMSPVIFASLHLTSLRLPFFLHHFNSFRATLLRLPSLFTSCHFTSRFVRLTSLHFTPLCFASRFSASLHATSWHFTPPPVIFTSLHTTSLHLPFCLPHFTSPPVLSASLHATSLYFTSPPFFSPHLTSSHLSAHPANFTIFANDSDIRKIQLW